MIRRPPRSTRTYTLFPPRLSSDLLRHERPHERCDVARRCLRITLAAAEDQPFVGREAEIVEHEAAVGDRDVGGQQRSEEHTSELQSLMRISYAVFCLKKKRSKEL